MTKNDLIAQIGKHEEVVATEVPGTFLRHQASFNNLHSFFRVVADDLVFMVSLMNASSAQAQTAGLCILDFAQVAQQHISGRETTKLSGLDVEFPDFDHLVALSPSLKSSPPLREARFLIPITVRCAAVNVCEFIGDEPIVELKARCNYVNIADTTRKIEPAVNSRFRFDNGQKSKQKFLAVTRQKDLVADIGKLQQLGGVVELENYERVGCVLLGKAGQSTIEVTLEGNTRAVPAERSVKFLDVFLRQGVEAARKEL